MGIGLVPDILYGELFSDMVLSACFFMFLVVGQEELGTVTAVSEVVGQSYLPIWT